MAQPISPSDPRLTWAGAISLEATDEWVMPTRIPSAESGLFPPSLVEKAAWPAGVRLSFWSDTTEIRGELIPAEDIKPIDLCIDGELVETIPLAGRSGFALVDLPARRKLIELWTPQVGAFRLKSLALSDGASLEPFNDARPRWITYGSSISHCAEADSPTGTWPAIVARTCAYNLVCLGYGAECHQDMQVATMIRDMPADFISLKLGINDQILLTHNARTFAASIIGFVRIIREKHPEIPVVLISSILSPPRETTPNAVGMSLSDFREGVEQAARALREAGDEHMHHVDGRELFGEREAAAGFLPDDVHPNAQGYRVLAENFVAHVATPYFGYRG